MNFDTRFDKNLDNVINPHPQNPYDYTFDTEGESTAAKVIRMVGTNKKILELGCACGVMSKVLKEQSSCRIYAVEMDKDAAEKATEFCEELTIADLDSVDWNGLFANEKFDVILAADVLEHLRNPERHLLEMSKRLLPDGYITLSVPNITYNGIIAELLTEDFSYRKTGLLDQTHIHFFALNSLLRTINEAELTVVELQRTVISSDCSEFAESWSKLPKWMALSLKSRNEGETYQYILKLCPNISTDQQPMLFDYETVWPTPPVEMLEIVCNERDNALIERDTIQLERDAALALVAKLQKSSSWRVTKPFRFVFRVYQNGVSNEDRTKVINLLRSTYHNLPIPFSAKQILRGCVNILVRKPYRFLKRFRMKHLKFLPPSWVPATQQAGLPDYIMFGVIPWHFRHQRPQHLGQGLTQSDRRVFYISPSFIDDERPGFEAQPLDSSGRLFEVKLHAKAAPSIYTSLPGIDVIEQLQASIGELLDWADSKLAISLVQHPFWKDIAAPIPNSRMVYDCMDHHEGFDNTAPEMVSLERGLLEQADLTITTSDYLDRTVGLVAHNRAVIRNGGEYEHFAHKPATIYSDSKGRRIIGYYGAIAEWFDRDLVEATARRFPEYCILLIGADTAHVKSRLGALSNVIFIGEVPYDDLPYYLYSFDVCLLPFRIIPLTLATNPVKVYEYLSAGKPIVSVDLPEMAQFGELVRVAGCQDAFLAAITEVLNCPETTEIIQMRKTFAKGQTWDHRVASLISHAESTTSDPRVSIIVVTYNNIELTQACLRSIDEQSHYANIEIIVVDNASSDGSQDFLTEWAGTAVNRKLICNNDNRGFAAANNQGLEIATGDFLVLLNNDTHVTPGWVRTLVKHFSRDKSAGLIGPVTNNIGNEAKINISYTDMSDMITEAAAYTRRHIGKTFPVRTVAFFCVMMHRDTYTKVGPLDESFGRGFFEDDDYCRRVEQTGLRIMCVEDVFIHHELSASFDMLKQQERQTLFLDNKKIYEKKWGEWVPHKYRGPEL